MAQQQQADNVETQPKPGDPGFTPMPHADDAELQALEQQLAAGTGDGDDRDQASEAGTEGDNAAGAEGDAEAGNAAAEGEAGAKPAGSAEGEGEPGSGKPAAIPHWRVREMVEQAEMRGQVKGLQEALDRVGRGPGAPAKAAEPEETPAQRITKLDQQIDDALEQLDAGKIDHVEYERIKRANERQIAQIREQGASGAAAPTRTTEDLRLAELTADLPNEFPVLQTLTDADVRPLLPKAYAFAQLNDIEITGDPAGDYQLRRIVAHLAQHKYGEKAPAAGAAPPAKPAGGPTLDAAARKLAAVGALPPDLPRLASGANRGETGPMTDQAFLNADVDDLLAVPDSAIQRIVARR